MSDLDLHYLATESSKEERRKVAGSDLLTEHRKNIDSLFSVLDAELCILAIKALHLTDIYWEYVGYLHAEQPEGEHFSYFSVRVRFKQEQNNLEIAWQKRYPVKGTGTSGRKTNSRSLNKGLGFRYPKKAFGQIRDWEYDAVEAAEVRFEKIRRQVEAIGKLRRSVRALSRLQEKNHEI